MVAEVVAVAELAAAAVDGWGCNLLLPPVSVRLPMPPFFLFGMVLCHVLGFALLVDESGASIEFLQFSALLPPLPSSILELAATPRKLYWRICLRDESAVLRIRFYGSAMG